jgi:hypothetical protein
MAECGGLLAPECRAVSTVKDIFQVAAEPELSYWLACLCFFALILAQLRQVVAAAVLFLK